MARGLTGAFPSPRHKLAGSQPFRPTKTAPTTWGVVSKYRMWGNDRYGDCVTCEEAALIANFMAAAGLPPTVLADADVIGWARKNGFLNGANLVEVMEALQVAARNGLLGDGSQFFVGDYAAVDWHDRAALCGAIYEGRQVNIAIASSGLGGEPVDTNGWMVLSAAKSRSVDHCVGLHGYGTLAELAALCGVRVPSGADPKRFCYLMFTWGTCGIVSEEALRAMTGEAWVRVPGSIRQPAYPPTPAPDPTPGPGPGPTPPPLPPGPGPDPTPSPPFDWAAFVGWLFQLLIAWLSRQKGNQQ